MPNVVDLCNEALANIGDSATVATIDPPDGSAQADHCARFYPSSRDAVLEMHDWGFASRRTTPALVDFPFTQWRFAYAVPNLCLRVLAVLPPQSTDDTSQSVIYDYSPFGVQQLKQGLYTPQPFVIETDEATGNRIILTNQEGAVVRYTLQVEDTTKYSPLFCQVLVAYLSAKLAGPIIKGDEGRNATLKWLAIAEKIVKSAAMSDSNQRHTPVAQQVPWMINR